MVLGDRFGQASSHHENRSGRSVRRENKRKITKANGMRFMKEVNGRIECKQKESSEWEIVMDHGKQYGERLLRSRRCGALAQMISI